MKLKRLFIAPHLLKKKLYNHQSLQKSDGSAEESINSCLKRKQKKLAKAQRLRQNHSEAGREMSTDALGTNQRFLRGLCFHDVVL